MGLTCLSRYAIDLLVTRGAFAFTHHSYVRLTCLSRGARSHLSIASSCDRIYRSQLDAIAFTDQS
ncbi:MULTISPECIES: hypothetical protein [unclassified Moorena]|uniref:hypothetical protein n=1 Tax=unclassified Moorena TaxID=2683338 RepID=UPI0014012B97|nr:MULTISPECIES: hypothetical protein [unclassified Moorena]NEO15332.1 hypothetical protein [Moorena sp. SIO3E8]NEQ01733.1 hypothetical protein [Moorena sp. SIO3F7]